jgi:hypothetical protein
MALDKLRVEYFIERRRLFDVEAAARERGDHDAADRAKVKNLHLWREEDKRLRWG